MLNILLSALIDPDRRLRSFRRSERLASILVCNRVILGPIVVSIYLCKYFGAGLRACGVSCAFLFISCSMEQQRHCGVLILLVGSRLRPDHLS